MKGLAWDDHPKEYMAPLSTHLERFGIELVVEENQDDFFRRYENENGWDFVITDLVDDSSGAVGDISTHAGMQLAHRVTEVPVFLITAHPQHIYTTNTFMPPNVEFKSKSTLPTWMAPDIVKILKERGVFVRKDRVFLIYGHDEAANRSVEEWLIAQELKIEKIKPNNADKPLWDLMLEGMNECVAFISIYSPDDELKSGQFQARPNVIFETGMAAGLGRGAQRLIILQDMSKPNPLPSDLAGLISLRYEKSVEEVFPAMEDRLKKLGTRLAPPLPAGL